MTQTIVKASQRIDLEKIQKKKINLVVFGHGNVGALLIDQIIASRGEIIRRKNIELNIFAIANSQKLLLTRDNFSEDWRTVKCENENSYSIEDITNFAKRFNLDNLIAIDNTANSEFVKIYPYLIENGFNVVSSNKIANTTELSFYKDLRKKLKDHGKEYLYETNVGAGLPLVDTIKLLHLSGENITRIKGVFSGSLSYLFNEFSAKDELFSTVLKKAIDKGFTEPDPREDLCGNDVGRKLLILARELDLHNEIDDVKIENLIPLSLRLVPKTEFFNSLNDFDVPFHIKRKNQKKDHVLRYVGELRGDLSKNDGAILDVRLLSVPKNSMLGQLKGSDSIFEIYTESYGKNPIVIQGAGAGAAVTARGVFGDILRLSDKLN
ncbi:homoserine dehydrogenase [Ulvibacter antarcticus]|uniref:Homoserine dehydrogenase n=1 Tax=Ulvibacter antarcticus TaxID=442714 RepID=A0A3L9YCJ7_9FLAO|nr:homoserine dehydrogenase [Ulvibacter antarcticus]